MAFLAGKFARFRAASVATSGAYRWSPGFRRERLDTTNFESVVGASGVNVHTEGLTGPLDSTFQVEGCVNDATVNLFFPDASVLCDLLYRKNVELGYRNVSADVLEFSPNVAVREAVKFTVQFQANGLVSPAS